MKKVLLVVAALALVLSGVNAVDVKGGAPEVTVSVSGSAQVQFGIDPVDADSIAHGFANASSASASITILPATPATSKGDEETYATITVADVKVAGTDGAVSVTAGSVSAKIVMGAFYINILGVDTKIDRAAEIVAVLDGNDGVSVDNNGEYKGLEFGYAIDGVATISVGLNSENDWASDSWTIKQNTAGVTKLVDFGATDKPAKGFYLGLSANVPGGTPVGNTKFFDGDAAIGTAYKGIVLYVEGDNGGSNAANVKGLYNIYTKVGITAVENLTANIYANGQLNFAEKTTAGFGLDAAYTLALSETMKLVPSVAVDSKITSGTAAREGLAIAAEGVLGVNLTMPGSGITLNKADSDAEDQVTVGAGLTTKFRFTTDDIRDAAEGSTFIAFADGDLLPVVNAALFAELRGNPGNDMDVALGLGANAALDMIKPYFEVTFIDTDALSFIEATDAVSVVVGVDVTPIKLLTLNAQWKASDVTYSDSKSYADSAAGTLVLTAKITL